MVKCILQAGYLVQPILQIYQTFGPDEIIFPSYILQSYPNVQTRTSELMN